jgi:hypothetical protein
VLQTLWSASLEEIADKVSKTVRTVKEHSILLEIRFTLGVSILKDDNLITNYSVKMPQIIPAECRKSVQKFLDGSHIIALELTEKYVFK